MLTRLFWSAVVWRKASGNKFYAAKKLLCHHDFCFFFSSIIVFIPFKAFCCFHQPQPTSSRFPPEKALIHVWNSCSSYLQSYTQMGTVSGTALFSFGCDYNAPRDADYARERRSLNSVRPFTLSKSVRFSNLDCEFFFVVLQHSSSIPSMYLLLFSFHNVHFLIKVPRLKCLVFPLHFLFFS